jgi:hypothetical protein
VPIRAQYENVAIFQHFVEHLEAIRTASLVFDHKLATEDFDLEVSALITSAGNLRRLYTVLLQIGGQLKLAPLALAA